MKADYNKEIDSCIIKNAVDKYAEKAKDYRAGKTGLMGLFLGEVMIATKGKADPKLALRLLRAYLDSGALVLTKTEIEAERISAYNHTVK